MAECPFCDIRADRILLKSHCAVAILDGFPVTEGHALVVPRRHALSLYDLSESEQSEIWSLVGQIRRLISERYKPDAFNIGLSDGSAAGKNWGR
jgi:diadenosine tetraphosphate (Ap4A) HIT family hydrolase